MAAVLDLEAQLASLKRKEADLKAEARRASKKQKRLDGDHHVAQVLHSASVSQKVPKLAKSMLHVICDMLILFQLSDFSNEVVVSYALGLGRPPRFQNHGYSDMWDSDLRSSLSYGFDLFFTSYDIAFLTDNLANCADSRLVTLCKYILEYKLFLWMVELNCEKGVHPPTAQLLVQAVRFIPVLAPAAIREKLKAYFSKMGSTAYQWAASFVERWGLQNAVEQPGEDMEPGLLRTKVACLWDSFFLAFWVPLFGILGPTFAIFGSHFWVRIWYPKIGPQNQVSIGFLL